MANSLITKGQFSKPLIHLNILTFMPVNRVNTIFIDVMSILFNDLNMLKSHPTHSIKR